ncbi:PaaI family thioesterase [Vreelandella titanicae]|uniref:Esterase n=1 Tax=Vreelandella titanicae TaxID=664683 RepID=A0AAP9T274_9GAMM|nr:PaaI family thioesterase [Halomonas titanicae]QKS26772.1 Putative esterase [Halomonas titanicae]
MAWTTDNEKMWNLTNPFRQHWEIGIEWVKDERAEISMPINENLLQAYGMVHGGIYCVLIDSVLGTAVRGGYGFDTKPVTTDLNVTFLRSTGIGTLYATAEVIKAGRKIAVGRGEVRDAEGRMLAVGRGSFLVSISE